MKLKCWIGPLLCVIILLMLRQMLYEFKNEHQQLGIPAVVEKKKPELNPPMAGTLIIRDTLPF